MIIRNAVECKKCGDIIESQHVHDFKWCKCRAIFVDGGKDYRRYGGDLGSIIDRSIVIPSPDDEDVENL